MNCVTHSCTLSNSLLLYPQIQIGEDHKVKDGHIQSPTKRHTQYCNYVNHGLCIEKGTDCHLVVPLDPVTSTYPAGNLDLQCAMWLINEDM